MTDPPEYADPERYAHVTGFETEWRDLWHERDFLELMARRWRLDAVKDALDVGCGAGHWTRTVSSLLPAEARIVGVDREAHFLDLAREAAEKRGLAQRARFEVGEAEALPFDDESFDLVTYQTVLIHVADVPGVLSEAIRVLRPGGLIVASEPDNLAGNLAHLSNSMDIPLEERIELVRFDGMIQRGKKQLGEGDASIGALLPGIYREVGLEDIQAYTNDRCVMLLPPYDAPDMQVALDQELEWAKEGISMFFGSRNDAHRLYLAGGGEEAGFERGWGLGMRYLERFQQAIAEGTYHGARGYLLYFASGRKPTSDASPRS